MTRGRKPDPAAVQLAKGNPGKRKIIERPSAELAPAHLQPPKGLSRDAIALWREILPEALRMNFIKATDRAAFARYCQTLARYWEAEKSIGKKSVNLVKTVSGDMMPRINPWVVIRDRLELRLLALEDRLGFSPMARQSYLRGLVSGSSPAPELPLGGEGQQPGDQPKPDSPVGMLVH